MAERFLGDGAPANGFGRRDLCEDEARLLYETEYSAPFDMRVPGSWRLSAVGVPMSSPPTRVEWLAEIACTRPGLPENSRNLPRYAPDSDALSTAFFDRRHADQLATTNGVESRRRHNSKGRHQWWGVPGHTLEAVLEHIKDGNTPRYEYPPPWAFSRRRGSSWTPSRMESTISSSSGSCSRSLGSPALLPVKPKPHETPLGQRTRNAGIVINEPNASSSRFVRPKTKSGLLPVKQEHLAMAMDDDEAAVKWARDDYV
ncbi:Homeobox protein KNOX3 [Hordeum vulgare]|nr:Homeobox protein KNOX3 [Hordeum vulgare]